MWSYRLYRYPSPSASSLVYGLGKMDENSSYFGPENLASAIYRALETGTKLPVLEDKEEVRRALLEFSPQKKASASSENDLGNTIESEASSKQKKPNLPWKQACKETPDIESENDQAATTKPHSCKPSVLMLEALAKRRIDAVRQLHRACPQLLASIPLFDSHKLKPGQQQPDSQETACPVTHCYTHSSDPSDTASTNFSFKVYHCPRHKSSKLLDLAAENRDLLVFVLENHPDVGVPLKTLHSLVRSSKTQRDDQRQVGGQVLGDPPASTTNEATPVQTSPEAARQGGAEPSQNAREEGPSTVIPGFNEDMERSSEANSLAALDPSSPITICILRNNPVVLQYLIFKHVWQHFLLDEIFKQPQNSLVPDLEAGASPKCPDCGWFLPCVALMGCAHLLDLMLCGKFCKHHNLISPQKTEALNTPELQEEHIDLGGEPEIQEMKHLNVSVEVTREESSEHTGSQTLSSDDPSSTTKENTDSGNSNECTSDSSIQSSPKTTVTFTNKDSLKVKAHSSNHEADVSDDRSSSHMSVIPDPNIQVIISLPVMDRWISRCLHVKATPLHLACWRCDPASIRCLLRHNANVLMNAELLEKPDSVPGEDSITDSTSSRIGSIRSSNSSLEMTLNFVTVNLNSSSFNVSASYNSLEDHLKKTGAQGPGPCLTPLALLALGIRSPPDFSLSIGKSLGLVLPSLPELWGGQVNRSCPQSKAMMMDALRHLLDAGCSVNQISTVFGKAFRSLELLLQPSIDLYYAPLMPRGGRDSAVLRCMDLERVADIVLSACWELMLHGAKLGPSFVNAMEWNLFRMDFMFLQNEAVQWKFIHVAIFLNLFPPLDPAILLRGGAGRVSQRLLLEVKPSQQDASSSSATVDVVQRHLLPYSMPPRPSCIPWAPSTSRNSDSSMSNVSDETGHGSNASTGNTSNVSREEPQSPDQDASPRPGAGTPHPSEFRSLHTSSPTLKSPGFYQNQRRMSSPETIASLPGGRELGEGTSSQTASPVPPQQGSTMKMQMAVWALEERQRRNLEKFVDDTVRLAVPEACMVLILRFLCPTDLELLTTIAQHTLDNASSSGTTLPLLVGCLQAASKCRSLAHCCKLAVLFALRWRYSAVLRLPIPESLKRYLVDANV